MNMGRITLTAVIAMFAYQAPVSAAGSFEDINIFLERNVTDNDSEIMFKVTTPSAGLADLKIVAPGGRSVIAFKAPDSRLGMRTFVFESPEPTDDGSIKADFPAGVYRVSGSLVNGKQLEGKVILNHVFPEPAALIYPRSEANGVPLKRLQIKWKLKPDLDSCIVVIEDEATGHEIKATLPGNTTTFDVPNGSLLSGTEYKLAIGTVAKNGNASYVETAFTTATQ